ncbi:flagellar biosynthetic protein FliO [Maritalea mediterranea]|uniref:Flagellar biosynthetic protein FliO n=1 Tax=Maritalea mediterranea TaxID=2909667 RepID=A0ABS9EBH4_9HYPH|nr:flagellar biosynthetic protein FliO [Maritalea mediterranea]MCF4098806.1 flagellar biosynthetic protein FliO [Maritalea mediterranea]
MGFLTELLGDDLGNIAIVIGGLFITILAIILVVWLIKIAFRASRDGVRNRMRRLAVLQSAPVDNKRQLVIIRRDNQEHLLMIGGPNDVVIETGFQNPQEPYQQVPAAKTEPPQSESMQAKMEPTEGAKPSAPLVAKPRPAGPSRTTPVSPLEERVEPKLGESNHKSESNVTPMPNLAPMEKLQELARSRPDSQAQTLKYPGLLRGGNKQKDVDSPVSANKNEEANADSDKLAGKNAPEVEHQGADTTAHGKDKAKQD